MATAEVAACAATSAGAPGAGVSFSTCWLLSCLRFPRSSKSSRSRASMPRVRKSSRRSARRLRVAPSAGSPSVARLSGSTSHRTACGHQGSASMPDPAQPGRASDCADAPADPHRRASIIRLTPTRLDRGPKRRDHVDAMLCSDTCHASMLGCSPRRLTTMLPEADILDSVRAASSALRTGAALEAI